MGSQQQTRGGARAAAVLQNLGMALAAEVVKRLSPEEVEELAAGFIQIDRLVPAERQRLTEQCIKEFVAARPDERAAGSFAEALLGSAALSTAQTSAGEAAGSSAVPLRWIGESSADVLADLLGDESPRIVAVVFAALRPSVAARVLAALPDSSRSEILLALAQGQAPSAEGGLAILKRVDDRVVRSQAKRGRDDAGELAELSFGIPRAVEILRQCDRSTEQSAISLLQERSPEIAEQLSQGIFSSMDDLRWLEPRSLQTILRQIEGKDLAIALRGVSEQIRDLCLGNLSENAAADVREEIEASGPRRRRDVEAAQEQILDIVRKMIEEGEIDLSTSTEEDLV